MELFEEDDFDIAGTRINILYNEATKHEKETANNNTKRPDVKLQPTIAGYITLHDFS